MKRLITLALALIAGSAWAQTTTTNPTANAWETRFRTDLNNGVNVYYMVPDDAADKIAMYEGGSVKKPKWVNLGAGLARSGDALNVALASSQLTDSTATGQALMTASSAAAARSAIGAGTSSFDGAYASLTGIPSTFAPAAHTHPASQISDSTATGRALLTATDAASARAAIGAGSGSGSVTSITAGTGLSGGTITTSGTISLPNTGTAGTYIGVTTDAQGRVVSGTTLSINDAPGRSLVNSASATGFQISASRAAYVCYEGVIQTTTTIGGPASGSVFIETANTNSTTPGDWTAIAQQTASNTVSVVIAIQQVDGEPWSLCRMVAAGKYVRVRTQVNQGTVSFSINTTQQEVLM